MEVIKLEDVIKSMLLEADRELSERRIGELMQKYYSAFISAVVGMELD